jgi:predicted transposase/invertase (TIGR01784 family)
LNNRIYFKDAGITHNFEYYDQANKAALGGKTRMVTIELDKAKETRGGMTAAEKWAFILKNSANPNKRKDVNKILVEEEGISMAMESLLSISRDENERARLLTIEKNILDYQSGLSYARKEGLQQGIQQGLQQGLQQGIDEVLNLWKQGLSYADILKQMGR